MPLRQRVAYALCVISQTLPDSDFSYWLYKRALRLSIIGASRREYPRKKIIITCSDDAIIRR